ncbi:MAG: D-glycero-beta-D-manno-heptose-7-phosphate kinase [Elusimicrobia bacterium]|nr:D-glycero-beta-D-manno-heptose-7-phosphate kinase [Elusimicrobiota bacterium]
MLSTGPERFKLRRLVSLFKGKAVLVIGDIMLDQYIRGSSSRISPEAPVPVVKVTQESYVPGGAGNVANNLAALGAKVSVMGVIGSDETGRKLASELLAKNIGIEHLLTDPERVTSLKCRVIAERQQVVRFDRETQGPLLDGSENRLIERLPDAVKKADGIILSDYGKGMISPRLLKTAIALARRWDIPITVDPKVEHFRRYQGVTCITPNLQEAWAGMRKIPQAGLPALESLGRDILKALRSDSVLITRGPDGMSLFKDGGQVVHIPTQAQEVFDVTGAGDTVIAALTLALASGADIKRAAMISNQAAGIVVGKLGTATASVDELLEALR